MEKDPEKYINSPRDVMYVVFDRIIWASAVFFVLFACETVICQNSFSTKIFQEIGWSCQVDSRVAWIRRHFQTELRYVSSPPDSSDFILREPVG